MNKTDYSALDSKLDLSFERIVEVPKELVWKTRTAPEHLKPRFCPLPWKTIDCDSYSRQCNRVHRNGRLQAGEHILADR